MQLERARELAAQAWCQPLTSGKAMDVELAEAFAVILARETRSSYLVGLTRYAVKRGDSGLKSKNQVLAELMLTEPEQIHHEEEAGCLKS